MSTYKHGIEDRAEVAHHVVDLADLKAFSDGELTLPKRLLVRAHLLLCSTCREEVKWLKRLGEDMRDLERAVPSPRLRARILAALPDSPPGRPDYSRAASGRTVQFRLAFGAVGILALAAFAIVIINIPRPTYATNKLKPGRSFVSGDTVAVRPNSNGEEHSPISATVAPSRKPDPTSEDADRRFAAWQKDQEHHAAQQIKSNKGNWIALLSGIRAGHGAGNGEHPLQIALSVRSASYTAKRIEDWARAATKRADVNAPNDSPPSVSVGPTVNPKESAPLRTDSFVSGAAHLVVVRVPGSCLKSLEVLLAQSGAWGDGKWSSHISKVGTPAKSTSGQDYGANRRPLVSSALSGTGVGTSNGANQSVGRDRALDMITLNIQLSDLADIVR